MVFKGKSHLKKNNHILYDNTRSTELFKVKVEAGDVVPWLAC